MHFTAARPLEVSYCASRRVMQPAPHGNFTCVAYARQYNILSPFSISEPLFKNLDLFTSVIQPTLRIRVSTIEEYCFRDKTLKLAALPFHLLLSIYVAIRDDGGVYKHWGIFIDEHYLNHLFSIPYSKEIWLFKI